MHEHLCAASAQEQSQSIHVSSAILYNAVYKCCIIAEALRSVQNHCLILIFITSVIGVPLLAQFFQPFRTKPGKLEMLDVPNKVSVRETIVKLQVSR